jgi:quinol monooxygenase YgiN
VLIAALRINVPPSAIQDVIALFESYRGPVSVRMGCGSLNLYEQRSSTGSFLLLSEWNSWDALEKHLRSEDFRKVLAIMDLAEELPDLQFHTVSASEGFELVERLRKGGRTS